MIYKTLVLTGLRKSELASITIGQCNLGDQPTFKLKSADEKNRQGNTIPISKDLAADLSDWLKDITADLDMAPGSELGESSESISSIFKQHLFNVPDGLLRIFNRDLEWAKIPKKDSLGRTLDIHSLRHTFGTLLSTTGTEPRTAQAAMRHSDLSLTMNVYTDPTQLNVRAAVEKLPELAIPPSTKVADQNMSPNMPPEACPEGNIPAHCSENRTGRSEKETDPKEAIDREKPCFPVLSTVGLTGFEPATSTPPV